MMKDQDKSGTLRVKGRGAVEVAPDEALINLRVLTEAKTASEAVKKNAEKTQAVVDAVSAQPNHGVTTTGLGVNPIIHYDADTETSTIVGFRAYNGVEVETKVGYAGQIYDAGIQAGANVSSGITFRVQNETPHREEALREATKRARAQAKVVAQTADVELSEPEEIVIEPENQRRFFRTQAADLRAATTPVLPDELEFTATVEMVFRTRL